MNKNYTNQIFGEWIVIEKDLTDDTIRQRKWICQHQCGYKQSCKIDNIYSSNGTRCKKCWRDQFKKNLNSRFFEEIKQGARKRKILFCVDRKYLMDLLIKQNFTCSLTGLPIWTGNSLNAHSVDRETTASLDRIDSKKGYIEGNVQWVHKVVNLIKSNLSDDELFFWCVFIVTHNISKIEDILYDKMNIIDFLCKKRFKQKYAIGIETIAKIREQYLSGESAEKIQRDFNLSKPTIKKFIKDIIRKKNQIIDDLYNPKKVA